MDEDNLPIGMEQMNQIFDVVDDLEISRELIQVDLLPAGEGTIEQLDGGKVRIVLPATKELLPWLTTLAEALRSLGPKTSGDTPGGES